MTDETMRRRDDEVSAHLISIVTEQNKKIDAMTGEMHQMQIHMAELKAISGGKVDQLEYRVDRLEATNKTIIGSITGIVMAVASAFVVWLFQQWGSGTPIHKP